MRDCRRWLRGRGVVRQADRDTSGDGEAGEAIERCAGANVIPFFDRWCIESMTFAGRRVLVVEDDFLVSLATTDLLESEGCVIVGPAAHLAEALRLAQSESLDAGVLDIDLAGEMVWPVAEALHRRQIPFLFLSAFPPLNTMPVLLAGAPYLEKPLQPARMLYCLNVMWGSNVL